MKVSVVIPVYNQAFSLEQTLQGFGRQTFDSDFEVLVVDDGSSEDLSDMIQGFEGLNLKYFRQENKGRAAARNLGIAEAEGDLIIFNDADRIPGLDFVQRHVTCHLANEDMVAIGTPKEIYFSKPENNVEMIHKISIENNRYARFPSYYNMVKNLYNDQGDNFSHVPWISTFSGNMSVRKTHLEKVNMFDEGFKKWGFEHFELGYRLFKSHLNFKLLPQAINYHIAHPRSKDFYKISVLESCKYLKNKYPEDLNFDHLEDFFLGRIAFDEYLHLVSPNVLQEKEIKLETYLTI